MTGLDEDAIGRSAERVVSTLERTGAWIASDGSRYSLRLGSDTRRRPLIRFDEAVFTRLVREERLALRPEGGWRLRCGGGAAERPTGARPSVIEGERAIVTPEGCTEVRRANLGESPLAWLARRRGPDGTPWLTAAETAAGERLREDFERAGALGRLTMAWDAGPRTKGGRGSGADPLEYGHAARMRTAAALDAVGPQLRGVLEQVCMRGSALAVAERELKLPRRAGKTVLKLALARLAEHYRIG